MVLPMQIKIEQFDMANERLIEPVLLDVILADNYIQYSAEYYAEQPKSEDKDDHTLGWEEIYANFKIKIKRETICSLDINWVFKRQLWQVEMEANGYPNTVKWYFKKEKDANEFYKKLDEYIFGYDTTESNKRIN